MSINFVFSCYKVIVFPFMIQEQLISYSFCRLRGWSILIQSFAKFIMGDILADTAILSKKEPLCSCYEHTSRARLQLNGMAAEKRGLCLSGKSVNMQLFLKDSLGFRFFFIFITTPEGHVRVHFCES